MKTLLAVLLVPCTVLGQITMEMDKVNGKIIYRSEEDRPVRIMRGNAVSALFKVICNSDQRASYFDLIIYTSSYREALGPFDKEALVLADGLGKIIKIHRWTTRTQQGKVMSSIALRLSREEFKSIGYAGTVGLKIGDNVFRLPYKERYDMRQLITQIEALDGNKVVLFNPAAGVNVHTEEAPAAPLVIR